MPKTKVLVLMLWLGLISCQHNSRPTAEALFHFLPNDLPKYDLKKPDAKYFLPYVLEEISGMSYFENGIIACLQDEDGKVFLYNHKKGKLERTLRFDGGGDYEGIASFGNQVYIAESNGNIYKFKITEAEKPVKLKKYKTILKKSNDIEGLAYDNQENKLIIACKDQAGIKENNTDMKGRGFYHFDLEKKKVEKKPIFNVTKNKIKKYLEEQKEFSYEANRINFKPSGIALHPINDHYYIIASVGKLILITNRKGEIKGSIPIDPRLLGQPEGICFAPNGNMFISSEGQGDKGYILKFDMKR